MDGSETKQRERRKRPITLSFELQPWSPPPPRRDPLPSAILKRRDDTPWLWIGNENDAINSVWLEANKITHFVHVCRDCRCIFDKRNTNRHLHIGIKDELDAPIQDHFESANAFLSRAKDEGANVLVHCSAGVSRSASIVLAYLINMGFTYVDGMTFLKEKRPCVNPNIGFCEALMMYETKYQSRESIN